MRSASNDQALVAIIDRDVRRGGNRARGGGVDVRAASQRDPHPAVLERVWLGEQAHIDWLARRAFRERRRDALKGEIMALAVGQDYRRCGRPGQLDRRDRQAEDRAGVKLEFVGRLADRKSVV